MSISKEARDELAQLEKRLVGWRNKEYSVTHEVTFECGYWLMEHGADVLALIDQQVEHKPCEAFIWHGPGHQSKTRCQEKGVHDIHSAVYGSMRQYAEWRGHEAHTGFFNEPPELEE